MKPLIAAALLILLFAEKPKVHSDFIFGTYPSNRQAEDLLKDEKARLLMVATHVGWSTEKLAKDVKTPVMKSTDLIKMSEDMEDMDLLRVGEYDSKPAMVVIREKDFERVKDGLTQTSAEFTKLLRDNWKDVEAIAASLEGSKHLPKEQVLYEIAVSGILLGGLIDAFWEDATMMLRPPRRGRNERYYAWFVESNPEAAPRLKREVRESSGYRIITIGKVLADDKLNPDDLRGKASVYDEADARRYRTSISVFSRDKLLPYFKAHRNDYLKLGGLIEGGRNVAFAEFFAWYYFTAASKVAENLAAAGLVAPPDTLYTYAVLAPR